MTAERRFLLDFKMAPGDVLMLSALVRDLKLTYEDKYDVGVVTNMPALWHHNPHLTKYGEGEKNVHKLQMEYSIQSPKKRRVHFVTEFHRAFEARTKIKVPVWRPKGDLHLTDEEKHCPFVSGRYWVIVPGGKLDATVKFWSQQGYQDVVDRLIPYGLRFVQEGAVKKGCCHPPLKNVLNLVGMTSMRDLIRNIYHAEGVICGITFPMHVAAVFDRPCVVLAGGREEPWWEEYSNDWGAFGDCCDPVKVPHRYLHTIGLLDCCLNGGCWKQRVISLPDRARHNRLLCSKPLRQEDGQHLPKCMDMITPDHVIEAVMWYYEQGYLPPPNWSLEERNRWREKQLK